MSIAISMSCDCVGGPYHYRFVLSSQISRKLILVVITSIRITVNVGTCTATVSCAIFCSDYFVWIELLAKRIRLTNWKYWKWNKCHWNKLWSMLLADELFTCSLYKCFWACHDNGNRESSRNQICPQLWHCRCCLWPPMSAIPPVTTKSVLSGLSVFSAACERLYG